MKVLLVDDHVVVREGLKKILTEKLDGVVFGEAENSADLFGQVRSTDWDIVILDISLPGRSGFDALQDLVREKEKLPVLVLSMYPEDQFALRVLKAGARGYIGKEKAQKELVGAVRKVLAGGTYVSPSFAEKLVMDMATDAGGPAHDRLSEREYEVMRMIASGKTVSEVAVILCLSVKTVSTHRARILEKMRMKSNAEMTRYCLENQLL
jgi:DNA-binding NarL/FixJ family response regulator